MNPCCCGSLQTGTKIIAISQLVWSIGVLVYGVFLYTTNAQPESSGLAINFIVAGALVIPLATLLLIGAIKRNKIMCVIWIVLQFISLGLNLVQTLKDIASGTAGSGIDIGSDIIGILLGYYLFWVVGAFVAELRREDKAAAGENQMPRV